jgi:hypothetical protein
MVCLIHILSISILLFITRCIILLQLGISLAKQIGKCEVEFYNSGSLLLKLDLFHFILHNILKDNGLNLYSLGDLKNNDDKLCYHLLHKVLPLNLINNIKCPPKKNQTLIIYRSN